MANKMFPRTTMLHHHLNYNMFPPCPNAFDCALAAIDAVEDGRLDALITLPGGQMWMAHEIVEELHLECFIDYDEDDFEMPTLSEQGYLGHSGG
jgi:hypothetical protein